MSNILQIDNLSKYFGGLAAVSNCSLKIKEGSIIKNNVIIKGPCEIGSNNIIYQFSSIGEDTPDLKFNGEKTKLKDQI